jgi:hypothetical protein
MLSTIELTPQDTLPSIVAHLDALTGAGNEGEAGSTPGVRSRFRRALLVIPRGLSLSVTELRALRHEAAVHGITVALVTGNARLRADAAAEGISTFRSRGWAERMPWWRKPKPRAPISRSRRMRRPPVASAEPPPPPAPGLFAKRSPSGFRAGRFVSGFVRRPNPWFIELGLILVLVALLSGLLYSLAIIVPAAEVTVVPLSETVHVTVPLRASQGAVADAEAGTLPARAVSVQIAGEGQAATTGRRREPSERARGNVLLVNRTGREIAVPSGTVVATATGDTQRFATRAEAKVPPNGRTTVPVEALLPGPASNVRAGTITQVEGPLGTLLVVANEAAIGGGGTSEVGVVTEDDQKRLQAALFEELKAKALEALRDKLEAGEFLPPDSVTYLPMSPAFTPFLGDVAADLSLSMSVQAVGLAVKTADGNELALKELQRAMAPGTRLVASSIRYIPGSILMEDARTVSFSMTAEGTLLNAIDARAVRTSVLGLRPDQAVVALASRYPLARPAEVSLGPDWLPLIVPTQLPVLPWRIRVHVDWDTAAQTALAVAP